MAEFLSKEYQWIITDQKTSTTTTLQNIFKLTNNFKNIPKEYAKKTSINILVNEELVEGYIVVPIQITNEECKNAIRYENNEDVYYKQLKEWFELDFAWYDEVNRKVMAWGTHKKVTETIASIQEMFLKIEESKRGKNKRFVF